MKISPQAAKVLKDLMQQKLESGIDELDVTNMCSVSRLSGILEGFNFLLENILTEE